MSSAEDLYNGLLDSSNVQCTSLPCQVCMSVSIWLSRMCPIVAHFTRTRQENREINTVPTTGMENNSKKQLFGNSRGLEASKLIRVAIYRIKYLILVNIFKLIIINSESCAFVTLNFKISYHTAITNLLILVCTYINVSHTDFTHVVRNALLQSFLHIPHALLLMTQTSDIAILLHFTFSLH
jgi:hypothetical protein